MRRRALLVLNVVLAIGVVTVAPVAQAQQAARVPSVGVLVFGKMTDDFRQAFSQGLRDQGFVEGQTVSILWGAANGQPDQARTRAADYVRMKVDVIVAKFSPAVKAAQSATSTIPIVMAPAGDPIKLGFTASLGRPSGNITGVTGVELSEKRLELLKELIPDLNRVSLLLNSDDPGFAKVIAERTGVAASLLGIELQLETVRGPDELESAFAAMLKKKSGAVIVQPSLIGTAARAAQVANLAVQYRQPSISFAGSFADAGGLMSYGPNFEAMFYRSAVYAASILKGKKPRELPIEQATMLDMVINLKTARALGLTIAPSILLRADRAIEAP